MAGMKPTPPRTSEESAAHVIYFLTSTSSGYLLDKPTIFRSLYDYGSSYETGQAGLQICVDKGWLEPVGEKWKVSPAGLLEVQRGAQEQRLLQEAEKAKGEIWFNSLGLELRSRRFATPLGIAAFIILFTLMFGLPLLGLYLLISYFPA